MEARARDFAIAAMARNFAACLYFGVQARAGRVVVEYVERALAGVQSAFACDDRAIMRERLAYGVFHTTTLHLQVKTFETGNDLLDLFCRRLLGYFLLGHFTIPLVRRPRAHNCSSALITV